MYAEKIREIELEQIIEERDKEITRLNRIMEIKEKHPCTFDLIRKLENSIDELYLEDCGEAIWGILQKMAHNANNNPNLQNIPAIEKALDSINNCEETIGFAVDEIEENNMQSREFY